MMYGMVGGMWLGLFFGVVFLLGFAFIVWVLAVKESGWLKIAGQIISIIIVVAAALMLLYSGVYCGMMGRGRSGGMKMMGVGKEQQQMMKEMMKDGKVKMMMEKYMKDMK